MASYNQRSQVLISGDSFHTLAGLTVSGDQRLALPFPAFATWNKEIAIETAKGLNELSLMALAVGHGPAILTPKQHIEKALDAILAGIHSTGHQRIVSFRKIDSCVWQGFFQLVKGTDVVSKRMGQDNSRDRFANCSCLFDYPLKAKGHTSIDPS